MSIFKIFIENQHLQAEKFILIIEYMCLWHKKSQIIHADKKEFNENTIYKLLIAYDFCNFVKHCVKTQTTSQSLPGQT